MSSDMEPWGADDYDVFKRLMRISNSEIIRHRVPLINREAYFAEIAHLGDLFLDPETGVATGKVRQRECYVFPFEVRRLLDTTERRIIAIYQHACVKNVSHPVNQVLEALKNLIW